ncbi:MAG: TonB C-terminal domain-containing protein [Nannocystaceae bacterium]
MSAAAGTEAGRGRGDLRPSDVLAGLAVAVAVLGLSVVTLAVARSAATTLTVAPGVGTPIAVRPVLDVAVGTGRKGSPRSSRADLVPRAWARAPRPSRSPDSSSAVAVPRPPSGTHPRSTAAADPSLSLPSLDALDDPTEDPAETEASPVDTSPGPADAVATGGPESEAADAGTGGPDEGDSDQGGDGLDPQGARAVALYRDRLARWLSQRFVVHGSGLSPAQLRRQRVRAILHLDYDGTLASFEIIASGNAAFDQAARDALESAQGVPLPTPPDDYPSDLQREIRVTFVCKESQCD